MKILNQCYISVCRDIRQEIHGCWNVQYHNQKLSKLFWMFFLFPPKETATNHGFVCIINDQYHCGRRSGVHHKVNILQYLYN